MSTKSSFLDVQISSFEGPSGRNRSFIYLLGTYQLPGSVSQDGDTEVEDQLLVLRNLGSTGRGVLSHRTEPSF